MDKGISYLLAVLQRRSLPAIATFGAVLAGAIAYLVVAPRLYQASARLMLDDRGASVSELGRDLTQLPSGTQVGASPLADQAELVKSQHVLKEALQIFYQSNNIVPQGQVETDDLSKGLSVKTVPATNILELSFQHKNPELAANLLNAISKALEKKNTETIRQEAANVRKFLKQEVPKARRRLEAAELAENKYRQISGIVSFEEQAKSLVESLANVEDQERVLAAQLRELRSQEASLKQITDTQAINKAYSIVRGGQDEQLKELRTKLTDLETKLAAARALYTEDHPTLQGLIDQRNTIRQLYTQGLDRVSSGNQAVSPSNVTADNLSQNLTSQLVTNNIERLAVEEKLKTIQAERAALQRRLAELPIRQQQLTPLMRQRQEAAESFKLLQSKYEEARIAEAQQSGNIRIIEPAQLPTDPAQPREKVVLALAIIFGTLLASSVVLLLEMLDNTLRDASEAEELLKLPLLGVLPRLPSQTLVLEPAEYFLDNVALVEPYRMLLKTLEFRSSESLQVILVTSTISGEGKSVVASHLAAVAAMLSRRTLLIDADLRRPVQHNLFNLAAQPGISDVIGNERSLLDTVQRTHIENLEVLTCGESSGRPSQLLESVTMKSLLNEVAAQYDLVILDTPPISASADAATLSRQSDGVILVTRPSFTLKEVLARAVSELIGNQIPILGVVVNGMNNLTEKYYRYPVDGYQPRRRLTAVRSAGNNAPNHSRLN